MSSALNEARSYAQSEMKKVAMEWQTGNSEKGIPAYPLPHPEQLKKVMLRDRTPYEFPETTDPELQKLQEEQAKIPYEHLENSWRKCFVPCVSGA